MEKAGSGRIKSFRLLLHHLKEERLIVAEGPKIYREALGAGLSPRVLLVTEEYLEREEGLAHGERGFLVTPAQMSSLSLLEAPPGLMALFPFLSPPQPSRPETVLALERVQDPGNLGTLFRNALLFGVAQILLSPGCASPYNPKVIRSSMGSLFSIPFLEDVNLSVKLSSLQKSGYTLYLTSPRGGARTDRVRFQRPLVIVLGNEGHGLEETLSALPHTRVTVPTTGRTDSLGVATAGAILMAQAYSAGLDSV